jgi:hypothetical protein
LQSQKTNNPIAATAGLAGKRRLHTSRTLVERVRRRKRTNSPTDIESPAQKLMGEFSYRTNRIGYPVTADDPQKKTSPG